MSLLVGPTGNWRQVFLNFESKNESLFFFLRGHLSCQVPLKLFLQLGRTRKALHLS